MNRTLWILALIGCAATPFACGFPTVGFVGESGGNGSGGHGASSQHGGSSSSSNPVGGGGTSSMTAGGSNGGGGSGMGGAGGGGASSTGVGGDTNPCPGEPDPCDCDDDKHRRPSCPGDGSKPADDCADHDNRAYKGATTPQTMPIVGELENGHSLRFDFDCDGHETPTYPVLKCGGLGGTCSASQGWPVGSSKPACGDSGDLQKCTSGLACSYDDIGNTVQSCL